MNENNKTLLAAVDMGTNSFHIVIAEMVHGQIRPLDRISEKVRLGKYLDENRYLTEEGQAIALETLRRFAQRIKHVPKDRRRVVGTSALRTAKNVRDFIIEAEKILECRVDIIAGREEARLIYLGVAHTLSDNGKRLVIDIGGGSTELILGKKFKPILMESLDMGCLNFQQRFFPGGQITREGFEKAELAARQEILNIESIYKKKGWDEVVGSSGTIRALEQVAISTGLCKEGVTVDALTSLKEQTLTYNNAKELDFSGLREDRKYIFPSGLALVSALYKEFNIKLMHYSDGALREGLLYDILGRIEHEDVRFRTINVLQKNYDIDVKHANHVKSTALELFDQVKKDLSLEGDGYLLEWTALIHEIGLFVSHNQYHQHGAYLILHCDLPGFSRREQEAMSLIIQSHRKKINLDVSACQSVLDRTTIFYLSLLLRLSVLLNHSRHAFPSKALKIKLNSNSMELKFKKGWLEKHPLMIYDLEQEKSYLENEGIELKIK